MFCGRACGRPLTHIVRDTIFIRLVDGFQWNMPHIFKKWVLLN